MGRKISINIPDFGQGGRLREGPRPMSGVTLQNRVRIFCYYRPIKFIFQAHGLTKSVIMIIRLWVFSSLAIRVIVLYLVINSPVHSVHHYRFWKSLFNTICRSLKIEQAVNIVYSFCFVF